MINPQLLEYVRQQVAAGVSKENIQSAVMASGGWSQQDVNEAFAALGVPAAMPVPQPAQTSPGIPQNILPNSSAGNSFVYAGFWRRFVAIMLDNLLVTTIIAIFALVVVLFVGASNVQSTNLVPLNYLFASVLAVCLLFYYPLLESSSWQGTIGKRLMGLRVTDKAGLRISFLQALARYLLKILSAIFFIGFIMAAFTSKKQGLHDLIAGTLVLKQAPARVGWVVGIFVVVIGIPLSIFAYSVLELSHAQSGLADAERLNDMHYLQTQLELYSISNGGTYPSSLDVLVSQGVLVDGQKDITDPVTHQPYQYQPSTDDMSYTLCTQLNAAPTEPLLTDASYLNGQYCIDSNASDSTSTTPASSATTPAPVQSSNTPATATPISSKFAAGFLVPTTASIPVGFTLVSSAPATTFLPNSYNVTYQNQSAATKLIFSETTDSPQFDYQTNVQQLQSNDASDGWIFHMQDLTTNGVPEAFITSTAPAAESGSGSEYDLLLEDSGKLLWIRYMYSQQNSSNIMSTGAFMDIEKTLVRSQ